MKIMKKKLSVIQLKRLCVVLCRVAIEIDLVSLRLT